MRAQPHLSIPKSAQGWWWVVVIAFGLAGFYLLWDVMYAGQIFPGVKVGQLDLSGATYAEAEQNIADLLKTLPRRSVTFQSAGFQRNYTPKELGIVFAPATTTANVVSFGRHPRAPLINLVQRLQAAIIGVRVSVDYQEQLDLLDKAIGAMRRSVDQAGVDGEVIIDRNQAITQPAIVGQVLDNAALKTDLQRRWEAIDFTPLALPLKLKQPKFSDELVKLTVDKINQSLQKPYQLVLRQQTSELTTAQLWQWVEVIKRDQLLVVRLRPADLAAYLQKLKTTIDQPVQDAVWVMKNEQVIKFQPDQPGVKLRIEETAQLIQANLLTNQRQLELSADYTEPRVRLAELNYLGINELIARGESNFSGSPNNRRHNIKIGAAKFDRVLVAPNEEFSFNKVLGEVTAATGYLPELVIKGDTTTPEFGGGLCQVSTTAFRAALNGGYPITKRSNHTYRVSYYEPAGTDATVYQPYPDLKFLNDTSTHILIHTYIKGDKLYFDFYGTKLNRRVELEGPRIYNITESPPPIYVETSDLPEGEVKKIDTAHRGADTVVYRYIYDATGKEIRKDTFNSHYIPWPAKYLKGAKVAPAVETNLGNVPPDTTAIEAPPSKLPPTN